MYRSTIQIQLGATRGKRSAANGRSALKEVELKSDIGSRRLPSPDVRRAAEKERTPEFVVKPRRQFVDEGQTAKFKVSFEGSPATQLSWSRDGKSIECSSRFKMYEEAGYHYLEVCNVTADDSGMYSATVQNSAGSDTASAELDVFEKPKLLSRGSPPPTVSLPLTDMDITIGDHDVKLQCEVIGGVNCAVTWYHNGEEIRQGRQYRCRFNNKVASLTLTDIREDDGGVYDCVIANSNGEVKTSCTLSTQEGEKMEAPVFIQELQDMEVEDGDKVELVVEVKGSQPIQVYWFHNDHQLTVDTPGCLLRAMDGVHSLTVSRVNKQSEGEYVCEAYNEFGDTDTFCRLRVKEVLAQPAPPEIITCPKLIKTQEGKTATFTYQVKGHPLPAVSWERSGYLLNTCERYKISSEGDRHSLQMLSPQQSDAGRYICHVYNQAGSITHTCSLIVSPNTSTDSTAAASSTAGNYRAVLKPCGLPLEEVRQQSSTDSECFDKENKARIVGSWLNKTAQITPPIYNTVTTSDSVTSIVSTTINASCAIAGSVIKDKISFSIATRTGRSRDRQRDSNFSRNSLSPCCERLSLTSRKSYSPVDRARSLSPQDQQKLTVTRETAKRQEATSQKIASPNSSLQRTKQIPVPEHETSLIKSRIHHFQAASDVSNDLNNRVTSTHSSFSQTANRSVGSIPARKPENDKNGYSKKSSHLTKDHRSSRLWRDEPSEAKNKYNSINTRGGASAKFDFRSVLKHSQSIRRSRISGFTKDSKANVQLKEDFRCVLDKMKNTGGEKKSAKSGVLRTASFKVVNKASSSDVKKLKSKFETPTEDFRSVHLKSSCPQTVHKSLGAHTDKNTNVPVDWKTKSARDITTPKVTDFMGSKKQSDITSSLQKSAMCSEASKSFDSPHGSDSGISSSFSRLADSSGNSSPISDISSLSAQVSHLAIKQTNEMLKAEQDGGKCVQVKIVEVSADAPSILHKMENQRVSYGGQAVFKCKISGVPKPAINWTINKKNIKPSKFFQVSYKEEMAKLVVAEAYSEDEGEYTCIATNTAGSDSCSCYLTVEASSSRSSRSGSHPLEGPVSIPPRILTLLPSNLTVRRGQPFRLDAAFIGDPVPAVKWCLGKTELTSDKQCHVTKDVGTSSLSVSSANSNHSGCYSVVITSDLGSDQKCASLSVEDVPEPPMGCPQVYDISSQSVSLSWNSPAYDGGSAVTHYVVEVLDSRSQQWSTLVADCQSMSYHALNLMVDRTYKFRVRAGNKLGLSEPSLATDSVSMVETLQSSEEYESDGCCEVFSPSIEYRGKDELPFEPRQVTITRDRKFEDYYEYLFEVGKGKFGNVYKCREKATNKMWAAKVIKVQEKNKAVVRQEVEIMNQLAHPKLLLLWDAFEAPQTMVLVMEFVGAGELFERVIREDFVLTERDCVHFMQQICTGVGYMHCKSILHLDLKPENVLCVADNSNQIKIIDFGLAKFYQPGDSLHVLFGTPEFIAPEVINYDKISFATDLWSIGVICYILLTGLSPFLGDTDAETLANVTSGDYDFDDESFDDISSDAKDFISRLLVKSQEKRATIDECEMHPWLAKGDQGSHCKRLNTDRLRCFMARRKWQKAGNAFRALGRMASLQKILPDGTSPPGSSLFASDLDIPTSTVPSCPVSYSLDFCPITESPADLMFSPLSSSTIDKVEENTGNPAKARDSKASDVQQHEESQLVVETKTGTRNAIAEEETNCQQLPLPERRTRNRPLDSTSYTPSGSRPTITVQHRVETNAAVDDSKNSGNQITDRSLLNDLPLTTMTATGNSELFPSKAAHGISTDGEALTPPSFLKEMVDCSAFSGDAVRFDVKVTGQPTPQLTWMLEEEEIKKDARHVMELGENGLCSLIVRQVTKDDEGEYSCRAVNSQGEVTCSAELHIYRLKI